MAQAPETDACPPSARLSAWCARTYALAAVLSRQPPFTGIVWHKHWKQKHTIPRAVVPAWSDRTHALAAVRRGKTELFAHSRQLSAQMATVDRSPPVELAESSGTSTPPEREPVMDCRLVLTTLSGATINVSLSIAKFDRFEDLEDHVMDYLVSVTDLKVFGCSIEFLHLATQTYLEDPIWDKLRQSMEYCIIFKDCSEVLPPRRVSHPQNPACRPRPHESRGRSPRRGVRRSATPTSRQH